MSRLIAFLVVVACVVALAFAIASLPGMLSGQVGPYEFETPISVAIGLLIALAIVLAVAVRLLTALVRLPFRLGRGSDRRMRRAGDRALTASLVALAAGETEDARREATRARRLYGDTPQVLLVAAEADRAGGRTAAAETSYRALAERKDSAFLGLAGLARLAVERGDDAAAAALVDQADRARPDTAWVRGERLLLASRRGDWAEAFRLARDDAERAAFATADADAEGDRARATKLARQAHRLAPGLAPAALAYARRLREEWNQKGAVEVLRETWLVEQNPALAQAAVADQADRLQRVGLAQAFVAGTEDALESRLFVARACLEAGMIGEARRHALAAQDRAGGTVDRRIPMLLSEIAEADPSLGETERRAASAEQLRLAARARAEPGWTCGHCHARHPAWGPICRSCSRAGRIGWSAEAGTALTPVA